MCCHELDRSVVGIESEIVITIDEDLAAVCPGLAGSAGLFSMVVSGHQSLVAKYIKLYSYLVAIM